MNMSEIEIKRILLLVGFFVLLFSTSQLSWGSGYVIDWDNLNNGIRPESSDVYFIMSSVGQSVTGSMQGGGYVLVAGFWTGYYKSGDVTYDGKVDLGDVVFLINYLYRGGQPPSLWETGDVTCDGVIDLGDVVYLINYLFRNGPPPLHCDP
jgi:hypothetical protein